MELQAENVVRVTGAELDGTVVSAELDRPAPQFRSEFTRPTSLSFTPSDASPDPCAPIDPSQVDPRFAPSIDCGGDPATDPFRLADISANQAADHGLLHDVRSITVAPAPIPVPAALPLLLAALGVLGLGAARRRLRSPAGHGRRAAIGRRRDGRPRPVDGA